MLCIMLLAVLPQRAFAAQQIDTVVLSGIEAPEVGANARVEFSSENLYVPGGADYSIPRMTTFWRDHLGRIINNAYYCFEAGMTYTIEVNFKPNSGHCFTNGTKVILEGVDEDLYTVSTHISGGVLVAQFCFELPGKHNPYTIDALYFYGKNLRDGVEVGAAADSLCYAYDRYDAGLGGIEGTTNQGCFIGGHSYRFYSILNIDKGYTVAPDDALKVYYNGEPVQLAYTNRVTDRHDNLSISLFFDYSIPEVNWIDSVKFYGLKLPYAGYTAPRYTMDKLSVEASAPYYVCDTQPTWKKSDRTYMEEGEQFVAGERYTIELGFGSISNLIPEWVFAQNVAICPKGWEEASYNQRVTRHNDGWITAEISFVCQTPPPEKVSEVRLDDIDFPVPGDIIDVFAEIATAGYEVKTLRWYDDTAKVYLGGVNSKFTEGHNYALEVELQTIDGFAFGSFYETKAYVNGDKAAVLEISSTNLRLLVEYPNCSYQPITEIHVTSLDAPLANVPGDYQSKSGRHYSLVKNDHYYFENGIGWYDLTGGTYLSLGEAFLAGHVYQAELYLQPSVGYRFSNPKVFVNGVEQTEVYSGPEQTVVYVSFPGCFAPGESTVGKVDLAFLSRAAAGKSAPYGISISPANCMVDMVNDSATKNGVRWYDQTLNRDVKVGESLIEGHRYHAIIHLKPVDGYYFTPDLTASCGSKNVIYTAASSTQATVMVDYGVLEENGNPFLDVSQSDYFYEPVLWAVDAGITAGISPTAFGPEQHCTRAQAVTFLWRSAGSPKPGAVSCPFTDVSKTEYYYDAMLWAVEKGITKGTSDTTFSPDQACTRAQIVSFLWRSEGKPASGGSNTFRDVSSSAYYYDAVLWAVNENITSGTDIGIFSPEQNCTRGQIVSFLYRHMTN